MQMTGKQRLLAAAHGEPVDRLPWAPRIDMWYNAHKRRGTLPADYRDKTMWDIIRMVGGDLYFNSGPIYREVLKDVEVTEDVIEEKGSTAEQSSQTVNDLSSVATNLTYGEERLSWSLSFPRERRVHYHTPIGTVSQKFLFLPEMELGGVTVPYQVEHWIKEPKDYAVVEYIIAHTEIVPQHDEFLAREAEIGDAGIVMGFTDYSPFHKIMREYMGYEHAIYELHDRPDLVEHLYRVLWEKHQDIQKLAVESPAVIVQIDSNWNEMISPRIFRTYFVPYFRDFTQRLHEAGKLVSTHCDGELKHLLPLHKETGLDIAECLTPAPMCEFTLAEARAAFADRTAIWGGLPAIIFSEAFPDSEFIAFMEEVGRTIKPGRRIVLGMGDNLPVDAKMERLFWITEWAAQYPVA